MIVFVAPKRNMLILPTTTTSTRSTPVNNDCENVIFVMVIDRFDTVGDIFEVLSKDSANWWTARYKGVTALLPANYVDEI
jgi:hypothetical protein